MDEPGFSVHLSESAEKAPPAPPSPVADHGVFFGANGLRAGWRVLIFLAFMALIAFALVIAAGPLVHRFHPPGLLTGDVAAFLAALAASLVMSRLVEHRSLADYGLAAPGAFGLRFWAGLLTGFVALTALLVLIHLGHGFDFGTRALAGSQIGKYATLWGASFLAVGFAEEYVFRGYLLSTLTTGMGFWPSAVLLSALFGAVHLNNAGENWTGALSAGLIGLFLCLTLRRTGSLWFAIGLHAGWDFSQSFVYAVPDSGAMVPGHLLNSSFHGPRWLTGGNVGPEGSLLVFVVILVLFLAFNFICTDVRFPLARTVLPNAGTGPGLSP